jgi:hypothetical protein
VYGQLQNARARSYQIASELSEQMAELESSQERNRDYQLWGVKYLLLLERTAHFARKKAIPRDALRFFDENFGAALALLDKPQFRQYKSSLANITLWCKSNGIKTTTAPEILGEA